MTDDYRDSYSSNPRPYHYYKVFFTVFNKYTSEYNTIPFYISAKRSKEWLESLIPARYTHPLAITYFTYSYKIVEVEDDPQVVFHHITTKESWERTSQEYFLTVCALSRWKVSWYHKTLKLLKNLWKTTKLRLSLLRWS